MIALLLILPLISSLRLHIESPPTLLTLYPDGIPFTLSPIGFRPLAGILTGTLLIAQPQSACEIVQDAHSQHTTFMAADDTQCLQSVKAKQISNSGSHAALLRYNPNTTLTDKESNLVHIPLIELPPQAYDILIQYDKAVLTLDFTRQEHTADLRLSLWYSPTDAKAYSYLIQMQQFLMLSNTQFTPHYLLQSNQEVKSYVGCWARGQYCPSEIEYQNKDLGVNVLEETLRQIILWKQSPTAWWAYIKYFNCHCLPTFDSYDFGKCSEEALFYSEVDLNAYNTQYQNSFLGQKETDDNTYLREERQLYVREQITTVPCTLLNGKEMKVDASATQSAICRTTKGSYCAKDQSKTWVTIGIVAAVSLCIMGLMMVVYSRYIKRQINKEIKTEVDKTLGQYYRYMDTLEEGKIKDDGLGKEMELEERR